MLHLKREMYAAVEPPLDEGVVVQTCSNKSVKSVLVAFNILEEKSLFPSTDVTSVRQHPTRSFFLNQWYRSHGRDV